MQHSILNRVHGLAITGSSEVAGGKSISLKAEVTPSNATNKSVIWSADCASSVGKISSSGSFSAKKVTAPTKVVIRCTSKENPDVYAEKTITIMPAVTSVIVTAPKTSIDIATESTVQLSATTLPEDASKAVTWKSSSTKIATVDENGLVTALKAGTVTITATATDGTKKSGSIKLTVLKRVHGVEISGSDEVAGGKSITLKAVIAPTDATTKTVTWGVDCASSVASISSSGKLSAKAVSEPTEITVTCTSKENPECSAQKTIRILPAVTKITLSVPATSVSMGDTLQITASCTPGDASQNVIWKSGSAKIATVDANGVVTCVKAGKVTITATAADGSRKKATITITVTKDTTK